MEEGAGGDNRYYSRGDKAAQPERQMIRARVRRKGVCG